MFCGWVLYYVARPSVFFYTVFDWGIETEFIPCCNANYLGHFFSLTIFAKRIVKKTNIKDRGNNLWPKKRKCKLVHTFQSQPCSTSAWHYVLLTITYTWFKNDKVGTTPWREKNVISIFHRQYMVMLQSVIYIYSVPYYRRTHCELLIFSYYKKARSSFAFEICINQSQKMMVEKKDVLTFIQSKGYHMYFAMLCLPLDLLDYCVF